MKFCLLLQEEEKKSEAVDCIMSFIRKMENLNKVKVKELRSDNGTVLRNHKLEETLIEAARPMLNGSSLPKQFWGEAVNAACYAPNLSIIMKRHGNTSYDVFRGRSPDISYFIQELEETFHVTFNEADEVIRHTITEGDDINFNENRSFPDDEFLVPRKTLNHYTSYDDYVPAFDPLSTNNITIPDLITPTTKIISSSSESPDSPVTDDYLGSSKPDESEPTKPNVHDNLVD
ncbi:retrovirus-related pol polyprotein from transposon TNT 1-94 [Tanacetum coccineum]